MTEHKIAPDTINNAPVTNIGAGGSQSNASIQDRTGLYLAIVAFAISFLSLGMQLNSKQGEDDRVRAAVAEAEARMAEKLAQANETANSARTFGRLANEKSDRVLAQLEVRGLVKPENH